MIWYCYETRNLINGKYYRGKSGSEDPENDGYLGSGPILKRAISKYGRENFKKTILATFKTEEEAYEYERSIITLKEVQDPDCYNVILGGHGGTEGAVCLVRGNEFTKVAKELVETYEKNGWVRGVPEDLKLKRREYRTGVPSGAKGTHRSQEWKDKYSAGYRERGLKLAESRRGSKHTEEWKEQHSAQLKGRPNLKNRGRKLSEEVKQRMSESHRGVSKGPVSEEVKNKIRDTLKQRLKDHPRVRINNGTVGKLIEVDRLDEYLAQGWVRGKLPMTKEAREKAGYGKARIGTHHSEETKAKMKAAREGKPGYTKGKTPINNGEISKYVTPEELNEYLSQGWVKGRLFRQSRSIYKNQIEK